MLTRSIGQMLTRSAAAASALTLATALTADGLAAQATGLPTFFAPTRGFGVAEPAPPSAGPGDRPPAWRAASGSLSTGPT